MNCRKVSHLLSAYIDGELPGVEHRQIHEHLNYCPECSAEYDGLLEMKRLLARLRVREPDASLPTAILQRVEREETQRTHRRPAGWFQQIGIRLHEPVSLPQGLALGACAVVVGVLFAARTTPAPQGIQWQPISADAVTPLAPPTASAVRPLSVPDAAQPVDFSLPLFGAPTWPGWDRQTPLYQPVFLNRQDDSAFQAPRIVRMQRQARSGY